MLALPSVMASLEDYDEFGNYIGADLDSDDEEESHQYGFSSETAQAAAQPLEGYDEEPAPEENALMDVDGMC